MKSEAFEISQAAVKSGLFASVVVLILIGASSVLLVPGFMRGVELRNEITELNKKIQKIEKIEKSGERFDEDAVNTRKELQRLKNRSLKAGQQAKVIALITEYSKESKLTISSIKPDADSNPAEGKKLKPIPFNVTLLGRFPSIAAFLDSFRRSDIAVTVNHFEIESDSASPESLKAKVDFLAYQESAQ